MLFMLSSTTAKAQLEHETLLTSKHFKKAQSLLTIKKLDSSLIYLKKGLDFELQLPDQSPEKILIYYYYIGLIHKNLGEYQTALNYFRKFLRLAIKEHGKYHSYVGYGILNIGVIYENLLKHNIALDKYKQSLTVFRYCEKNDMVALIYNNIGDIYTKKGEINTAIEYYNKSINLGTELFGENHIENGKSYKNIGFLYTNKKEFEKALQFYQKSLAVMTNAFGENNAEVGDIYIGIGDVYQYKKEFTTSLTHYQKALEIYANVLIAKDPKIAKLNLRIAKTRMKQKGFSEFERIIAFFDKAIIANKKIQNSNIEKNAFTPSEYYDPKLLLEILHGKAKILYKRYRKQKDVKDLHHSLELYEQTDILIDYIRKSYHDHQDKILFAENAREVYADAIKTQFAQYKLTKAKPLLEKVIYYIEKSKANTLKDLINNNKEFFGLPNELVNLERIQKINRTFYQSRIIEERSNKDIDYSKIETYENQLLHISKTEDSLESVLKNNYPKYYQLKHENTIISVNEIQKTLKETTNLLEFFTYDTHTYVFVITKNKIVVKELDIQNLEEKIKQFRSATTNKHTKDYKTIAHTLYLDLIAPVNDHLTGTKVTIIPDGVLWHLNFDLLLSSNDISNNPKELPYLLKKYAISYGNSANLLFADKKKSVFSFSPIKEECLAFSFSNTVSSKNSNTISLSNLTKFKNDLPGTRREINAIANIIKGNYFYGADAIETNFKKNVSQYYILHLALHGEVDHERPENSKLYFTKGKNNVDDDLLYSHELFALEIPADLTVLSACNTGAGKIAKGEGIMSLGTAFQYAGTKSLLLTSWEVSDQTTPDLMKYFYVNLKQGMSKSKALQQAKLTYLQSANVNRSHPFYWGGFYLVGEDTPITFVNNSIWYWGVGIGVLALLLGIYFIYQRKVKKPHMQA